MLCGEKPALNRLGCGAVTLALFAEPFKLTACIVFEIVMSMFLESCNVLEWIVLEISKVLSVLLLIATILH
jgi:hypothetical protein